MNREEYLDLLAYYLRDLPSGMVKDILYDYREHFIIGEENGKTQEEISVELGPAKDIARQFLELEGRQVRSEKKEETRPWTIGLLILGGLVAIPIALPILALLIGLIAGGIGIIAGLVSLSFGALVFGLVVLLSFIPGFLELRYVGLPSFILLLNPLTKILIGLGALSFSIFIPLAGFNFFKWLGKNIRHLILTIRWKINKRRSRDEE